MCKVDPYVRITANNNGETKCIIFVDSVESARKSLKEFTSVIVADYPFISGVGAHVSVHKLDDLSSLSCVKAISGHTTVTTYMNPASGGISLEPVGKSLYGQGVTVAVIDTGLSPHIDLLMPVNRTVFEDFIEGKKLPYDDNGHGTAVCSIIAGNGLVSNGKFKGVAPKANIIGLKAISSDGMGGAFAILEAMQWIYTNRKKYNIGVVCMSFGSEPITEGLDPLSLGAEALWNSGIVVVASAGNDGPKENTIKSPGCNPKIITVGGAVINEDSVTVPDFSSRGPVGKFSKPDIIAPAIDIACCGIKQHYSAFTGTSMAAPIVAGAATLILGKNPKFTPDKVKEVLLENAIKLDIDPNSAGKGLLSMAFLNEL